VSVGDEDVGLGGLPIGLRKTIDLRKTKRHTSELKNQGFCLSLRFAKLNKGDRRGQHQRTLCAYDLRNSIPPIQGTIRNFASKEANTMSSEQALADGICSLLGGPEYFTLLCP
jgi:hypothetical protein